MINRTIQLIGDLFQSAAKRGERERERDRKRERQRERERETDRERERIYVFCDQQYPRFIE